MSGHRQQTQQSIERQLGLQYATVLQNSQTREVREDCKQVIDASLAALEFYNRVAMNLKSKISGKRAALQPESVRVRP